MRMILATILMILTSAAGAEGLPLPWPFPWAKECAVDWQQMAGRYVLSDSNQEQIDLKITVIRSHGFRIVRLSRFSRTGALIADGFSFVSLNQRMLRMKLVPRDPSEKALWALIKLHHADWALACATDDLVPILTLERSSVTSPQYYRLIKLRD